MKKHTPSDGTKFAPNTVDITMPAAEPGRGDEHMLGIPDTPGTTNTPGNWAVTEDRWLKDKHHWTDRAAGKAAIEFVSRITLGGLFYSLMENSRAMQRLGSYERHYHGEKKDAMFLEKIAFFIDNTLGKGMYKFMDKFVYQGATVNRNGVEVAKAREFLRFRENRNTRHEQDLPGRSIGAEMTVVTASFAAMSAGSAIMRNVLSGIFNPRERKSWSKDGKFDPAHIAKKVAGKVWQIGTYNAGEDMAVALPYVFYMRGQRNLLDKVFRGFKYSSDGVDNGGGLRIDEQGKVTGNYLMAGALDLQGRFTVYNVFTQLYRDLYDNIGAGFNQWWKSGKELRAPTWLKNPATLPSTLYQGTKHLARYTTISAIRSIIQMTPSVPFFSMFRIPGSKVNGMAVHADHGALHFLNEDDSLGSAVRANLGGYHYGGDFKDYDKRYDYLEKDQRDKLPKMAFADGTPFNNTAPYFYRGNKAGDGQDPTKAFDPHGFSRKGRPQHESIGMRVSDKIARNMHQFSENDTWANMLSPVFKLVDKWGYKSNQRTAESNEFVHKRLAKESLMAGIPYATYFAAKVMTRESYVNEQMNMAVERLLDGVLKFNRKEIAAGVAEISNTVMRQPLIDPERQALLIEKHAQNLSDKSPRPTDWSADLQQKTIRNLKGGQTFDRDRVVTRLNRERSEYYASKIGKRDVVEKALDASEAKDWASKQAAEAQIEAQTHRA